MFNLWSQRDLSLYGKITIAKTLGLSKMIFSSACLPTPPRIVSSIDKMVTAFVWNNKPAKIKRESMIGQKNNGAVYGVANQRAVFQIWTNQRAVFGSRDRLDREGIFGYWDRVLGRACAVSGCGNDVTGNDDRARK